MVDENTNNKSPLLPDRHPTADFFVCDIFDAAPKGDMASMEHPIFSLSTKPDQRIRRYEHGSNYIEIKPSADGLASIHDRDILIYCISQVMAALNDGREVSQILRFKAYDLLVATNRNTAGTGYAQLKAALERLAGTRISTNIVTGGKEIFRTFGMIESAEIVRQTRDGRMQDVEIKLSDWVFNAIHNKEVLTLHRDYFRLRKPLERRMYELARKHCGRKDSWRITLATLQKKCGSGSTAKEFRRLVQKIVREDQEYRHMPDYAVNLDGDKIVFSNRHTMPELKAKNAPTGAGGVGKFSEETYGEVRRAAPGWCTDYLEEQWRGWLKEWPRHPEAAFIAFCQSWYERRGAPQ